jgi:hypothetical protein
MAPKISRWLLDCRKIWAFQVDASYTKHAVGPGLRHRIIEYSGVRRLVNSLLLTNRHGVMTRWLEISGTPVSKRQISYPVGVARRLKSRQQHWEQQRHVCPSVWNNLTPTGWVFMKLDIWVFFEYLSRKSKCHYNRTITGTLHEDRYTFFYRISFNFS